MSKKFELHKGLDGSPEARPTTALNIKQTMQDNSVDRAAARELSFIKAGKSNKYVIAKEENEDIKKKLEELNAKDKGTAKRTKLKNGEFKYTHTKESKQLVLDTRKTKDMPLTKFSNRRLQ